MKAFFILSFLWIQFASFAGHPLILAENGAPKAEIVISEKPSVSAQTAALELKHHLDLLTGADFSIVTIHSGKKLPIYVGDNSALSSFGIYPAAMKPQEYTLAFQNNAIILAGKDKEDFRTVRIRYSGVNSASLQNIPGLYEEQGTMYAVYDFLRDYCGVQWLDPTDSGTVIPKRPTLHVTGKSETRKPFMRYRGGTFTRQAGTMATYYEPELWDPRQNPAELLQFRKQAYPAAYKDRDERRGKIAVCQQQRLFLHRMKAGGEFYPANHSFYYYYERFLQKGHPNFEEFKPQYFAQTKGRRYKEEDFIFSAYDTRKEPPQLCYSNPETFQQVMKDIRDYFDTAGYRKKYRNIGTPGHIWGKDTFCVEAMDNDAFCQCARCTEEYEPDRAHEHSQHSTHWFKFVNKIARELKKTHPGKKISTLAYGTREGLPRGVKLEDNVVVYFAISADRMPYSNRLSQQLARLEAWHKAYPETSFGLWLYNTFPCERTVLERGYLCFPGFFGSEVVRQFHLFKKWNVTTGIFQCGFKNDFENYLNLRLMCDPDLSLKELKDTYFASFGRAEKPIRAFYDLVEERYCNPAHYKGHQGHQNKRIAWGLLGTVEVMKQLGSFMDQAERLADTPQAKARVANWKADIWEYMRKGKRYRSTLKNETEGVRVVRTEYNGGKPDSFGKNILQGKPVSIWAPGCVFRKSGKTIPLNRGFTCFTDGAFQEKGFLQGNAERMMMYCMTPVSRLSRLRITLRRGSRMQAYFTPVVLVDRKWIALCGKIIQEEISLWDENMPDGMGFVTLDLFFEKNILPKNAQGIGILDDSRSENWFIPEYIQIEAI